MALSNQSKIGKPDHEALLRKISFFACLSEEQIASLRQIIRKRRFRKNEIILMEENTSHFMYVVFSGKVKVVHQSENGKEHILAFHRQGDSFGEIALLDGKTTPASVISMEDTEIGLLAQNDFEHFLLNNPMVARHIISLLCGRLRESWNMLKVMSQADAEQRVRVALRQMAALYGVSDQRGTIIALKLTHKDIAEHAFVARETVSRLLKRLAQGNEIEVLDNRYLLLKPEFSRKNAFL